MHDELIQSLQSDRACMEMQASLFGVNAHGSPSSVPASSASDLGSLVGYNVQEETVEQPSRASYRSCASSDIGSLLGRNVLLRTVLPSGASDLDSMTAGTFQHEQLSQTTPYPFMLRPFPKLFLRSCGWPEVPHHIEQLDHGFIIDISALARNQEDNVFNSSLQKWKSWGGEGGELDAELSQNTDLMNLVGLLENLCVRYFECLRQSSTIPALFIAVVCNLGKHESRWVVSMVDAWLSQQLQEDDSWYHVKHLSDANRMQELLIFCQLRSAGWSPSEALYYVNIDGSFDTIRWNLFHRMERGGYRDYWIDLREYLPNAALENWMMCCLPAAPVLQRSFQAVCEFQDADTVKIKFMELSGREYCNITVPATVSIAAVETQCPPTGVVVLPNGELLRHVSLRNPEVSIHELLRCPEAA